MGAPNYNQTGTNRADIRMATYTATTSIRQVVPKSCRNVPNIETSRRLPELSIHNNIMIKTSSNVIGTYLLITSNHSEEHKTKTDHQAIFLFITGKPQREKPRRNKYFSHHNCDNQCKY